MRAPALLIVGLALLFGGLLWLLRGSSATSPAERARLDPPAARPPVVPTLELPRTPTRPAEPIAVPTGSERRVEPEAPTAAVPRTAQGVWVRIAVPSAGGLEASDAEARLMRGGEVLAGPTRPAHDGGLVLELEAPEDDVTLVVTHPACVPSTIGPLRIAPGERRSLGVVRPRPAGQLELVVEAEPGRPAAQAFAWVLPARGRMAGPLPAVAADPTGRLRIAVPLDARGVLVRGEGRAVVVDDATVGRVVLGEADAEQAAPRRAGRVVAARDGRPLAAARVEVYFDRASLFSATCDADGRFDLGSGLDGRFELRLWSPGHIPRRCSAAIDPEATIELEPERRGVVQHPRSAARVLAVLDSDRRPSVSEVQLFEHAPSDAEVWLGDAVDAQTDADGELALDGAASSLHTLVVRAPGHEPLRVAAGDLRRRTTVTLVRGEPLGVRVATADGRPVPGCPIAVDIGETTLTLPTGLDGTLRLDALRRATLQLSASAPLGFEPLGSSEVVSLAATDSREMELTLTPD